MGKDSFRLKEAPITGIAAVTLFTLGIIMLPAASFGSLFSADPLTASLVGGILFRLAGFAVLLLLCFNVGFVPRLPKAKALLTILPFFIVAVNNLPILALAGGRASVTAAPGTVALFALWCLSVSLIEETAFRGLVLPFLLLKTQGRRRRVFLSVLIGAAIFGLIHLVNLLSNPVLPVLAQIGYSFLIGGLCGVAMVYTRSILPAVAFHAVYDFCGLLIPTAGTGVLWDTPTIVLTIVLAAVTTVYVLLVLRRVPARNADALVGKTAAREEDAHAGNQG